MKKLFVSGMLLLILGLTCLYREPLVNFYVDHFVSIDKTVTLSANEKNDYFLGENYSFVQSTTNFTPSNKQDILNIYYTILDRGLTDFVFYCSEEYKECIQDVKDISNNQVLLSHINNFVHPYNSFKSIETEYDTLGKITIKISHTYTDEMIRSLQQKTKEIQKDVIQDEQDPEKMIKLIHDYIINNSRYDSDRSDQKTVKYQSDTAYGNLIQGYGICGGYADSMKLFLDLYQIPNYKIASENHVWNLVKVNDQWLHLDLTWDDPIVTNGKDVLEYNFFLITTQELQELQTNQHNFDTAIYQEAK